MFAVRIFNNMRRKEKQITDRSEIDGILMKATVCRIAFSDGYEPYIVPVCFGHKENALYFHCAAEGRKLDILRKNSRVCFEVDADCEPVKSIQSCDWGMSYRSVIGFGKAVLLNDIPEKTAALDIIMEHYGGEAGRYSDRVIAKTVVVKILIESITGKQS